MIKGFVLIYGTAEPVGSGSFKIPACSKHHVRVAVSRVLSNSINSFSPALFQPSHRRATPPFKPLIGQKEG